MIGQQVLAAFITHCERSLDVNDDIRPRLRRERAIVRERTARAAKEAPLLVLGACKRYQGVFTSLAALPQPPPALLPDLKP